MIVSLNDTLIWCQPFCGAALVSIILDMVGQVDYTVHFEFDGPLQVQGPLIGSNINQVNSSSLPVITGDRELYDAWGLKNY